VGLVGAIDCVIHKRLRKSMGGLEVVLSIGDLAFNTIGMFQTCAKEGGAREIGTIWH
jgi:hypothetical protein